MNILFVQLVLSMTLAALLLGVLFSCSKKSLNSPAKSSPFECGFWAHKSSRLPFSLQFFLIALIFLVFDVELIFLFPMLLPMHNSLVTSGWAMFLFVILVIGGLLAEWSQGSLEWLK